MKRMHALDNILRRGRPMNWLEMAYADAELRAMAKDRMSQTAWPLPLGFYAIEAGIDEETIPALSRPVYHRAVARLMS